jgi:ADP-ribose pyrophosphatase YjhB (NUDIX family)
MSLERRETPPLSIPATRPIEIPEKDWERIHGYLKVVSSEFDLVIHHIGDWTNWEIEIVTDPVEIYQAEQKLRPQDPKKPKLQAFIEEGPFSTYINHIVKRLDSKSPAGFSYGSFHEVVWNFERRGSWGNAVLPVWTDENGVKRICLIKIFRRPTGRWEVEVPRFSQDAGETITETRQREIMEETRCKIVGEIKDLGTGLVDSGIMHLENHLWLAPVEPLEVTGQIDSQEAISKRVFLTLDEVKEAILTKKVQFGDEEVQLRDGGLLMVWAAA